MARRNTRPRDALGRPMPYGTTAGAVVPIPDDLRLGPDETLAYAERLLSEDRAFAAHEVLEARWKAAPAEERALWRGLAQVCVGLTHLDRGNSVGGRRLLRRGADAIAPYASAAPYRLDVDRLAAWAREVADHADVSRRTPPSRPPSSRPPLHPRPAAPPAP